MVIELLQPLDDRSPHAEFLATHGEGMHHLAFLVTDLDEELAAARGANPELDLLIDGTGPGNEFRWVYLDGRQRQGSGDRAVGADTRVGGAATAPSASWCADEFRSARPSPLMRKFAGYHGRPR